MKQLLNARTIVTLIALALGGVAAGDIPELNQYDELVAPLVTLLLGWVGLRRPGDKVAAK